MNILEVGELKMRLRNVKNCKEILKKSPYFVENPIDYKGNMNHLFSKEAPLMVEIGMGKGDFIIGMARLHPEWNFIGIEKYESVLVRAVQKLDELDVPNVKVVSLDAVELSKYFENEVDTIYLNFSDPWPKKRHHRRRLTYETFLKEYDRAFASDAKIIMKTDNDSLFEGTLISLNNYGYVFDDVVLDLWSTNRPNIKTEYEQKFGNKGFKIKYIEAHKSLDKIRE